MDVIPTTDALDEPTVMRQIRKLVEITDQNIQEFADTVNEGTYKSVSVTGPVNGMYTLNFVNQNDETESFNFLIKDIKTIGSSQSGSTVTLTITYSNNTVQNFTWTAGGDVTTDTAQAISGVKTFIVSPIVPDTPSGVHAAINMAYAESTVDGVNNLAHKSGNEVIAGNKTLDGITIFRNYIPQEKALGVFPDGSNNCVKLWTGDASQFRNWRAGFLIMSRTTVTIATLNLNTLPTAPSIIRSSVSGYPENYLIATIDSNNVFTLWAKRMDSTARIYARILWEADVNYNLRMNILQVDGTIAPEPNESDYTYYVTG